MATRIPDPALVADEPNARIHLAAAYRLVEHFGWSELIYNHLSVRVPNEPGHFLINGFGLLYDEVRASNLVKVDIDGNIVDVGNARVSRSAFVIHGAIHEARSDVHCVMHCHTPEGCAVAAQRDGLLPLSIEALLLSGRIGYHNFEGMTTRPDEKARIVDDLGSRDVLIFRNHGLLTCGRSVAEAFYLMFMLQRACEIQVGALAGGRPVLTPSDAVMMSVAEQSSESGTARQHYALTFEALMRRLDRLDPSYRH